MLTGIQGKKKTWIKMGTKILQWNVASKTLTKLMSEDAGAPYRNVAH